jgi:hypothetical protein
MIASMRSPIMPRSMLATLPVMASDSVGPSVEKPGGSSRRAASAASRSGWISATAPVCCVSTASVSETSPFRGSG